MKLTNIVIREILLFLEFQELADNRLELVSKIFYHNIMEDNELLRRMINNYLDMIKDYQKEQEYQDSILETRKFKEQENSKEEIKEPERKYIKVYDDIHSNPIKLLKSLFNHSNKLMLMCERTTGGYQRGHESIYCLFQGREGFYNSCESNYFPNGLMCITAIPYSEDPNKVSCKDAKIKEAQNLSKLYQDLTLGELDSKTKNLRYSCSRYHIPSDESSSNIDDENEVKESFYHKLYLKAKDYNLKKSYRILEDHSYRNLEYIAHDKGFADSSDRFYSQEYNKIIEFDTIIQREIAREKLFMLTEVEIHPANYCTCPAKAIAIFVHDYPIIPEDHPLTTIVKGLYDSLDWNRKEPTSYKNLRFRWGFRNDSDEESKDSINNEVQDDLREKRAKAAEEITAIYKDAANLGIIPQVSRSDENVLEFSQKFYSKRFNSHSKEEVKSDMNTTISKLPKPSEYLPIMESLDMAQIIEDSSYRLVCIAYDMDGGSKTYSIKLPPNTNGRYITILGLDTHQKGRDNNYDVGRLIFSGYSIPSCLKLSK
ncbi:unnamed protein product [Moneuplotes crassus]|uniref:F-box domain-containing protein n=1 Tax=Euplotes crassus TaxID=5936 RepID=A0AAD1Y794_EUPCR|nr:unnamed protein product [Moneuplotes crassus]